MLPKIIKELVTFNMQKVLSYIVIAVIQTFNT